MVEEHQVQSGPSGTVALQRPMLYAAVAFVGGVVLASAWAFDRVQICILIVAVGALVPAALGALTSVKGQGTNPHRLLALLFLVGIFCLGLLRWTSHVTGVWILPLQEGERRTGELVLSVVTPASSLAGGNQRWEAVVREVPTAEIQALRGHRILVYSEGSVEPGDEYRVSGEVFLPGSARNPGSFNYRGHLLARGIGYSLDVHKMERLPSDPHRLPLWRAVLRSRILDGTAGRVDGDVRGLILALVLGDRDLLSEDLVESFRNAGLGHLLAISGLHVMTFGMVLIYLFTALLPRRPALSLGVGTVFTYSMLVGSGPSVSRAALLFCARTLAPEVARYYDPLNVLAASALVLVVHRPGLAFDVGFQMSFCACWALVAVRPVLQERLGGLLAATVAVYGSTLPLTLYHFETSSLVALLANPLLIPVFLPVLVSTWIAGIIAVSGGSLGLLGPVTAPIQVFSVLVHWLGSLPGRVEVGIRLPVLMFTYLTLVCLFSPDRRAPVYVPVRAFVPRKIRAKRLAFILLVWVCALGLILALPSAGAGLLRVTVFDVGQGDCILFETPGRGVVMIDTGPPGWGWPAAMKSRVLPYLASRGIRRIDYLVLTHGHLDHTGGALELMEAMEVSEVWLGPMCEAGADLECDPGLSQLLENSGAMVRWAAAGDQTQLGGVEFRVLWPPVDPASYLDLNEASVAVMVRYGDWSMLNMADVEGRGEKEMVQRYGSTLGSTVLKVGHHGSAAASGWDLLRHVRPELAVISVGFNPYGQPAGATLQRFEEMAIPVLTTQEAGAVILETDGSRWRVSTMLPALRRSSPVSWGMPIDVACF